MPRGIYLHKPENYPPSRKGTKLTAEHKRKVSESLKGNTRSLGYKHSAETKRLMRDNGVPSALGKTGRNHPAWKEEKTSPLRVQIRESFLSRQWRSDIFTRDNFTCALCWKRGNQTGVILNADHYPKMFSEIISEYNIKTFDEAMACEELWNLNNGRTLCVPCHRQTPTFGGRGRKRNTLKVNIDNV